MPMDGLTLGFVARELNEKLIGGRIDKVTQPEKDALVLLIRSQNQNFKLLLCASPNNARCHLTWQNYVNPLEPPMFCMLMRKHLQGGRIQKIQQLNGDRILHITVENADELGVLVHPTLILEIMGRHSNLTVVDENGRIIDAIRHVSGDMSRLREVLPGLTYLPPPSQDKIAPECAAAASLLPRLLHQSGPLEKVLSAVLSGLSAPAAREMAFRMTGLHKPQMDEVEPAVIADKLAAFCLRLPQMTPPVIQLDDTDAPLDIYPYPYLSRDPQRQKPSDSISRALESFFSSRDQMDRMAQKSASLHKILKNHIERCEKKLALQIQELENSARMEEYRVFGELITANVYQLKKGMDACQVVNYYDENSALVEIPLDKQLTPVQNAQKYYKKYQKARSAQQTARLQKEKTQAELVILEGAMEDLSKCTTEAELQEIRTELQKAGYVRPSSSKKPQRKFPESQPYEYKSSDGLSILVGKNSLQNDRLTGSAKGGETWLHAKDMPGSHVIIRTEGPVPPNTLKEAAQLAAYYSKGKNSSSVPIDYTLRKHVKKPGGSPAGFVIYTNQRTLYITVSEADIRKIELIK